ncbi:MAG: class I SAM-dependent methyltransferase [Herpetosiphon sp.]
MLSSDEIKQMYDRLGAGQDHGAAYEDIAINDVCAHAGLSQTCHVFEFGCGTGRVAADLLSKYLPPQATYLGVDLSTTMVQLTQARIAPWLQRAVIVRASGRPHLPLRDGSVDHVFSLYVLDILSPQEIHSILCEAHRVLEPGGRLCITSLTHGKTLYGRFRSWLWSAVYRLRPRLVGGCRPLRLQAFLERDWLVEHRAVVMKRGITSEVIVARVR